MIANVRVIPNAKQNKIAAQSDGGLKIHVTVVPTDGRANNAVIKLLAVHLGVPKSKIKLIRGASSRDKVFEILD